MKLSQTVGYIPKNGNTYSCNNVATIKPDPTSIILSIRLLTFHLYFVFSKIFFYAYSYWRTSAFFFLILMFSLGSFRGAVCLDQTLLLPSSSSISIIGLVSGPCITIPTTEGLSLSSCCSNNPAALANTLSTATLSCNSTSN